MQSNSEVDMLEAEMLAEQLYSYNAAYRAGDPLVSDEEYDVMVEQLRATDPNHPFLTKPEPEPDFGEGKVVHPFPMLSTEKSYTNEELVAWLDRVSAEAAEIGISEGGVQLRLTPKLDGLAGRYDGRVLATRGDGLRGNDVTHITEPPFVLSPGVGELVVTTDWFNEHLAEHFTHPRNFVAGLVGAKELNKHARRALQKGAVHFANYDLLDRWTGSLLDARQGLSAVMEKLAFDCPYRIDGWVLQVMNQRLQTHMGATSHHHRWMLAIKVKGETAETTVNNIVWQTGRTGQVTPVLEIDPVFVSGAMLSRVTAHHAGMVKSLSLGTGARIKIIRSGEVIPKIEAVLSPAPVVRIPELCPSCASVLEWDNDFLMCLAKGCPAKVEASLLHFFKTMGNCDLFGPATIKTLVSNGVSFLHQIFVLCETDLVKAGFSIKQSQNLLAELDRCRTESVEDWRFLAAMGIETLGKGASRKLLQYTSLLGINKVTVWQLKSIPGIGDVMACNIYNGVRARDEEFWLLLDVIRFNLTTTPLLSEQQGVPCGTLSGMNIVFTGSMKLGTRDEMEAQARSLGATVQSAVSAKTSLLVCGDKAGSKKAKAEKLGTRVMTEQEYTEWLFPVAEEEV